LRNGYFMKIAKIDLDNKQISYLKIEEKDVKKFIGGSGALKSLPNHR